MSDLLQPGASIPGQAVSALPRFRNISDDGRTVVESTRPLPATKAAELKYYVSTIPTASMHRPDGKRLPFINGFLIADLFYDQEYLDHEIADGNTYVRHASEHEVESAKMRLDPVGTVAAKITEDLELQIRTKLAEKLGMALEDVPSLTPVEALTTAKDVTDANITDAQKLQGTNAAQTSAEALLAKLKAGTASRSGAGTGATVVQTQDKLKPGSTKQQTAAPQSGV